ncbi:hypothetical protein M441DRAFT_180943 [Trichoderma asperellum CBS 433.97]|uniref:Uncharacterized protein n=1 Tax=Trichoderma asperellum (strain ATCC 204424 / CBS 433.97 / NBRC 101777) TaxID=1042311 RepID=A0A2T3ZMK6_TRIA4|nr:hypothetical protein M441DRAFT_180943 [Trichoderma asperellum CBS 433.97]PTB46033.1 hypothetical protein M441DRAFT_180943 [Trichoderma asperellum CBS 433.97]
MPVSVAARRRLIRLTQALVGGPVVVFGGLALWTRKCAFEPFGPDSDPLFKHPILKQLNPRSLPSSHDSCVRKVPFGELRPVLLEDAKRGGSALVEEFSRGMWGGYGYRIQRRIMEFTKGPENATDVWTPEALGRDTFEPGTVLTNHFLVLEKSPTELLFRGCLSPKETPFRPRDLDNFFALTAELNEQRQEAEFRLKAISFDAVTTTPKEDPLGGVPGMLHKVYAKLLVEAAVGWCVR